MKKIIFVINSLGAGGAEHVLSELANHLSGLVNVSIITLFSGQNIPFYPLNSNIQVRPLGKSPHFINSKIFNIFDILKKILKLRYFIKQAKPDLIVSFMDITNIATLLITHGLKIPVIVCERNNPHDHKIHPFLNWMRNILYPYAAAITVQVPSAKTYFPLKIQPIIFVIPNGVKKPLVALTKNHFQYKTIVNVGRLDDQKDQATLIKAFSFLQTQFLHWQVHIYGEGNRRPLLEKLIKDLNLTQSVFLKGICTNVDEILSKASIFVFPSKFEGFPNALAEAMSIGLPVIAANSNGNKDIVLHGKNGLLFPIGDVSGLATILRNVLSQPEQLKPLQEESKKISDHYDPDTIFKKWEDLILKCMN